MNSKQRKNAMVRTAVFAALFAVLAVLIFRGAMASFDAGVQQFFFGLRCPALNAFCCALEYVGHWPLPAAVCIVLLLCKRTRFAYGLPMAGCVSVSVGTYELLKHLFCRPRPDASLWLCQEHGFSFPSGHTLNNMVFWIVFASLLGYYFITRGKSLPIYKKDRSTDFYPKKKGTATVLRLLLILWPVIIGLSRILVGVHWPTDVLGSMLLSMVLINIAYLILFRGGKE